MTETIHYRFSDDGSHCVCGTTVSSTRGDLWVNVSHLKICQVTSLEQFVGDRSPRSIACPKCVKLEPLVWLKEEL